VSTSSSTSHGASAAPVRRTLNVPFLIISLLVLAGIGGAGYVVRNWQLQRTSTIFLTRADEFEASENWLKACENLDRYLRLVPDDHAARIRLARTFEKGAVTSSQLQRAIALYFRAIGTGEKSEELELRQNVGALLLKSGRFIEAEQEANHILELAPNDPKGLRLRAIALLRQYQTGALARESLGQVGILASLRSAYGANEGDYELTELLSVALRDNELARAEVPEEVEADRKAEADRYLDRLVELHPKEAKAFLLRSGYRMRYNLPGAEEDLQQAEQLEPNNPSVLLTAAQFARRESIMLQHAGAAAEDWRPPLQKARSIYERIVNEDLSKGDSGPVVALGEVLRQLGEHEAAIQVWKEGLQKHPNAGLTLHGHLAGAYLDLDRLDEASKSLDAMDSQIAALPPSFQREARLVLQRDQELRRGVWHIKRGNPELAVPLLRQLILRQEQLGGDSEQSKRAWLLLGSAYASLGEWVESATAYDRAATLQPRLPAARHLAAASWLAANRFDLAVERAEQAAQLAPSSLTYYTLATALLQQQSVLSDEDRVWNRLEAAVAAAAERASDGILTENWRIDLLQADYLLAKATTEGIPEQGRQQALSVLRRATSKYPLNKDFWQAVALVYQQLGESAEADAACAHLSELPQAATEAACTRARVLARRGEHDAAEAVLVAAAKGDSPVDAQMLGQELVNLKIARRDFQGARLLLLKSLERTPNDVKMLSRIADIDLELRNLDELPRWERALQAAGGAGDMLARCYRIRRLLLQAKSGSDPLLKQAADEVAQLHAARPTSPDVLALKGAVEQRLGRVDGAIMAYEEAVSLGEQRVVVFEQLIALLDSRNRAADAEKYLSRLKSHIPFSHDLTMFESTVEVRKNQPGNAVDIARAGVERRPNDASAHVWLGRMLLVDNQPEAAEAAFQKAVELAPENVLAWNGLFSFYVRTQNKEKAQQTLADLAEKAKLNDADRNFILAQGYELLGDTKRAASTYEKAAALAPQNTSILLRMAGFYLRTDPDRSQALLRKLLSINPNSGVARRTLAALLAARGTDADWEEAKRLVVEHSSGEVRTAQDNRLSAVLLIQRGGVENFERAAEILQELIERPDMQLPADRLMLAQLSEKQARIAPNQSEYNRYMTRARDQYISLCARSAPQAGHLVAYIEFLVRNDDRPEALRWLEKYESQLQANPKAELPIVAEYIRLALTLDQIDSAEQWLGRISDMQNDSIAVISLRARLMAKKQQTDQIEPMVDAAAERLLQSVTGPADQATVMQAIGAVYASVENLPAAERWYRKLYDREPTAFEPLAMVLARQKKLSEAFDICKRATESIDSPRPAVVLARILSSAEAWQDSEQADHVFENAVQRFPKDSELLFSLATLRVIQGRTDEAVVLFRAVVTQNPRHVVALNNLATLLSESPEHRKEALAYIDRAIEITGAEGPLFDTKGTILYFEGQTEQAVEFLKAAVSGSQVDPRFHFHLALAYHDLNDTEQARSELEAALNQQLEKQILTPTEKKLLAELRANLAP